LGIAVGVRCGLDSEPQLYTWAARLTLSDAKGKVKVGGVRKSRSTMAKTMVDQGGWPIWHSCGVRSERGRTL
jgi:hypothetical protein